MEREGKTWFFCTFDTRKSVPSKELFLVQFWTADSGCTSRRQYRILATQGTQTSKSKSSALKCSFFVPDWRKNLGRGRHCVHATENLLGLFSVM